MLEKFKHNLKVCRSKLRGRELPWPRVKPFVLLLPAILTGCQTTPSVEIEGLDPASPTFCQAARAIYYSKFDTKATIEQIREHNAVGVALKCGWLSAKGEK